jgi:hypothetical protein
MTFWTNLRNAQNPQQPVELRYQSLRHALTLHAPLGFGGTWNLLADRFGLEEGSKNSGESISKAADYLGADRMAWLDYEKARLRFLRHRVKAGLPKPKQLS